jgi:hypothetical protein
MHVRALFVFFFTVALTACTSMRQLESGIPTPKPDESIFLIGVSPENHRVFLFPGSLENGRFMQNPWRAAAVFGGAKDGFVVGKAKAGEAVAITLVRVVSESGAILGTDFAPCGEARTPVFRVPAGKVIYVGSVDFTFSGSSLQIRHADDIESAKRYLQSHSPELLDMLESQPFELAPTTASCDPGKIVIPIYIPIG